MACTTVLFLAILATGSAVSVTPVQKVIDLLQEMVEVGIEEKHKEEVAFSDFKSWCEKHVESTSLEIDQDEEKIDTLKTTIAKEDADTKHLEKRIGFDTQDMTATQADIDAAEDLRNQERSDYKTTHTDYEESIDAIGRAIKVLKKQTHSRTQASFAQISTLTTMDLIPPEAKKKIDLFLMQYDDDDLTSGTDVEAPESNAYEFQSGHVIEMLEKLHDKFLQEKTALEKKESKAKFDSERMIANLKARLKTDTIDKDNSMADRGATVHQRENDWTQELQELMNKKVDKNSLADLRATCEQKKSEFSARQETRADEIDALNKALDILKSDSVKGHSEKYLPELIQTKKTALSQLRSTGHVKERRRVVQYLQQQAGKLNSRVLSVLALHVADDPFTKVKKMIKDLVVRLMEEANDEAEHKGWCDTEMTSNKATREDKTKEVEALTAHIDELEAEITKLKQDIADFTQDIADHTEAMAEATKMRQQEKVENAKTVQDAKDAQAAVSQAMQVLQDFYQQASEATAFLQSGAKGQLAGQGKMQAKSKAKSNSKATPYQGMQESNTGVIGMLEVIETDFARLEEDTSSDEVASEKDYTDFMAQSSQDKAVKGQSIENKESDLQDRSHELQTTKDDLEGAQKDLDAAMAYYEKLKPSCIDAGEAFDDRVSRRKEEVESLQEALKILNGEEVHD